MMTQKIEKIKSLELIISFEKLFIINQINQLNKKKLRTSGPVERLIRFTQRRWQDFQVLFSEVENRVLVVNSNFDYLPFRLEQGKSTPLGLFTEAAFATQSTEDLPAGKHPLEVWRSSHQRSALLGRINLCDNQGAVYRDIDLKGIGCFLITEDQQGFLPGALVQEGTGRLGLLKADRAEHDLMLSEELSKLGVRTHRTLAIIRLGEIIANGNKYSLEEAIQLGISDERFDPVIAVRAFGTKARIQDAIQTGSHEEQLSRFLLDDARELVGQELGLNFLSWEEYIIWFARTLGENVGIMHQNGWCHHYLTPHNITLDCRIVDLDTISPLENEDQKARDMRDSDSSLLHLLNAIRKYADPLRHLYSADLITEVAIRYAMVGKRVKGILDGN